MLRFVEHTDADARDLVGMADVMVTDVPEVIDYAKGRSERTAAGLPWNSTYVLVSTTRVLALANDQPPGELTPVVTNALAANAVDGDARGAWDEQWWDDVGECLEDRATPQAPRIGHEEQRRIAFDRDDPVARSLAERIAALAAVDVATSDDAREFAGAVPGLTAGQTRVTVDGLDRSAFRLSLRRGDAFAYVVRLPRLPLTACYESAELLARAPWLAYGGALRDVLLPLVETRAHVIANAKHAGAIVDGWGNVRVVPSDDAVTSQFSQRR
jgi:hypothetical protein